MSASCNIRADVRWLDEYDGNRVDTLAYLSILVDDRPIWPIWGDPDTDLDVFAEDVLTFLTDHWQHLLLRQHYPDGIDPVVPSHLWKEVDQETAGMPRSAADILASAADAFSHAHDLSTAFGGQYEVPSLWFFRRGQEMLVDTSDHLIAVPIDKWVAFAADLGETIAARLRERQPDHFDALLDAWAARDAGDPADLLSAATGQSSEIARALLDEGMISAVSSVSRAANDDDELRIAARMLGPLPYAQIKRVLDATRALRKGDAATLDSVAAKVREHLSAHSEAAPHEQGVLAAQKVREELRFENDVRIDPFEALRRLGVEIVREPLGISYLDALAVWGGAHGPAVLLNASSRRFQGRFGLTERSASARVTAAHETCHLVVDRGSTLAAVDILNGRVPVASEKRANAFAAEFLLPAGTAARLWRSSQLAVTRGDLDLFIERLCDRFGVSRAISAWQLDHGLAGANPEIVFLLDDLVPGRRERSLRR